MKKLTSGNLSAFNGSGTESAPDPITGLVTLTATDDFYFPIPFNEDAQTITVHILTAADIAGTFTIEGSNLPKKRTEIGPNDVTDWSETSGHWVQLNNAANGVAQGVGTGWTVTVLSLVKTAGAGGASIVLTAANMRRLRLKAAITTSGGVRVVAHGVG